MDYQQKQKQFSIVIEVLVRFEQGNGKWQGKYRAVEDVARLDPRSWNSTAYYDSRSEAAEDVLGAAKRLFPGLPDQWIAEARAELEAD